MLHFRFKLVALIIFGISVGVPSPATAGGAARLRWPPRAQIITQDQGAGDTLKSCRRADLAQSFYPWNERGELRPECAPDTLYSWRQSSWTHDLRTTHLTDASIRTWPRPPDGRFTPRYFWHTPIGTFGYGDSVLRAKLRQDVRFLAINSSERDCSRYSIDTIENTVFVPLHRPDALNGAYYTEFLVCSESPIESWSIDAPQTAEEALRELAWIIRKSESQWDAYIPGANRGTLGISPPWFSIEESNFELGAQIHSSFSLFAFVGDRSREFYSYERLIQILSDMIHRWDVSDLRAQLTAPAIWSRYRPSPNVQEHFESRMETYFRSRSIANGDLTFLRSGLPPRQWVEREIYNADSNHRAF
jgi:hypothetical protein